MGVVKAACVSLNKETHIPYKQNKINKVGKNYRRVINTKLSECHKSRKSIARQRILFFNNQFA